MGEATAAPPTTDLPPTVPPPNEALESAPTWRREPYRVFFPLGVALAWAGVLPWALFALDLAEYRSIYHAIAQVEGFLACFVVGFLFTAIPRRTRTDPPGVLAMLVGIVAPVGTTVCAWQRAWMPSQVFWIVLVFTLIGFAVRRMMSASAGRRPPNGFVWVPIGLLFGLAGSAFIGLQGAQVLESFAWHELGKLLVLQGMLIALIVGVGSMVLPLITCGDAPPDGVATSRDRLVRGGHVLAAAALVGTFVIEVVVERRLGHALRAALILGLLVGVARIARRPTKAGWHRWLVWAAAWAIPTGYALAALFPDEHQHQAGLHLTFIGGFAMMALTIGIHVTLAHGGWTDLVHGRPWQVPLFGGLIAIALVFRAVAAAHRPWVVASLGVAAAAFLLATVAWAALVLPRLRDRPLA